MAHGPLVDLSASSHLVPYIQRKSIAHLNQQLSLERHTIHSSIPRAVVSVTQSTVDNIDLQMPYPMTGLTARTRIPLPRRWMREIGKLA